MLRSMRGNSKGLVVSGLMPKAATIGEVRLGPVLRVRFHVVPRQYQTDRYRPHSGYSNLAICNFGEAVSMRALIWLMHKHGPEPRAALVSSCEQSCCFWTYTGS